MTQITELCSVGHGSQPSRREARITEPRPYKRLLAAAFVGFAVWEGIKHLTLMAAPMWVQHGASAFIETGLALVIVIIAFRALSAHHRELERMRGMRDRLAYALANDLRQPLLTVIESLDELQRAPETTEGTRQRVEHAMQGARPLVGMAIELLRVTPPEEGEKALQRFNCSDLLRSALDTVQVVAAARRVEISADISGFLGPVQALPHSLVSAMVILLDNAVGATPNGGQVSVVGRIGETDNVEISITDTGLAMSDEDMRSLEDTDAKHALRAPSWARTGRSGLRYCAAVIGALSGTITVHRNDAFGNTVTISLPLALEEAP
jgi:signal transduction histidine kinase